MKTRILASSGRSGTPRFLLKNESGPVSGAPAKMLTSCFLTACQGRFGERSGQPSTSASAGFGDVKRELRDSWTAKHRNVMTKLVVEGGWVQKRVYDIGWSEDMRRKRQRRRHREAQVVFFPSGRRPDTRCWMRRGNGSTRPKT